MTCQTRVRCAQLGRRTVMPLLISDFRILIILHWRRLRCPPICRSSYWTCRWRSPRRSAWSVWDMRLISASSLGSRIQACTVPAAISRLTPQYALLLQLGLWYCGYCRRITQVLLLMGFPALRPVARHLPLWRRQVVRHYAFRVSTFLGSIRSRDSLLGRRMLQCAGGSFTESGLHRLLAMAV